MANSAFCKIIGGTSIIFGIGVLIASSFFLHESNFEQCISSNNFFKQLLPKRSGRSAFATDEGFGGFHQGDFPLKDVHGKQYNVNPSYFGGQHGGNGIFDPIYKVDQCNKVIIKYRTCGIVGVIASIIQILVSALYCFGSNKSVKIFTLGWIVVHFGLIVTYASISGIVLSETKLDNKDSKGIYNGITSLYKNKLAFGIMALVDTFIILLLVICAGLKLKRIDYNDYSVQSTDNTLMKPETTRPPEN